MRLGDARPPLGAATLPPAPDLAAIAARLEQIRCQLADLADEAGELLRGLGPVRDRARPWLAALDRATGTEPTVTIDDTIEEIRAAAGAAHSPAPEDV